jgi:hypothetical protein
MKKILLFIILCALYGCSTLPERKNPDDAVAVLKIKRTFLDSDYNSIPKPGTYIPTTGYSITIDENPILYHIQEESTLLVLKGLKTGSHAITSVYRRYIGPVTGQTAVSAVFIPFELKQGCITILNKELLITIVTEGSTRGFVQHDFIVLAPETRQKLLDTLSTSPAFKTWELAE